MQSGSAAEQNLTATAKAQRAILNACLDGTRAAEHDDWMPDYMSFPMGSYRMDVEAEGFTADATQSDAATDLSEHEQAKAA